MANAQAERLLAAARSQLGYREQAGNATKYGAWYGLDNNPWCMMFVSWCAEQAGIAADIIPKLAYVPYALQFFRARGRYQPRGAAQPRPGDIIFFGNADHVGIVERVQDQQVYSIEGNTGAGGNSSNGDGVYRRCRGLDHSWIMGYGAPEYQGGEDMEIEQLLIRDLDQGRSITVSAVNIAGSNYIRLRDAEKLFPVIIGNEGKTPTLRLNYTTNSGANRA